MRSDRSLPKCRSNRSSDSKQASWWLCIHLLARQDVKRRNTVVSYASRLRSEPEDHEDKPKEFEHDHEERCVANHSNHYKDRRTAFALPPRSHVPLRPMLSISAIDRSTRFTRLNSNTHLMLRRPYPSPLSASLAPQTLDSTTDRLPDLA